jgi:hypothetical protein
MYIRQGKELDALDQEDDEGDDDDEEGDEEDEDDSSAASPPSSNASSVDMMSPAGRGGRGPGDMASPSEMHSPLDSALLQRKRANRAVVGGATASASPNTLPSAVASHASYVPSPVERPPRPPVRAE